MARSEKRTLEIRAKLADLMTKPLGGMEGAIVRWSRRAVGSFKNVFDKVFNLKTAVIGLAASVVSLSTVKAFGEQADALLKMATSTGDTVENLSELQAAFDLAGVKAEDFGNVVKTLLSQVRKAQTSATDTLEQSFAGLGVTVDDLQRLGPAQLFEKMAAGLERYRTQQEKAVALGKVLPQQFLDLLPVLGGGLKKFQDAIVEARGAGATVTEQQAKVSERLNDSLSKIQIAIGSVSRALIEQFGPGAIALFERLATAINTNKQGIVDVAAAIGKGIVAAVNLATDAIIGLIEVIEMPSIGFTLIDSKALNAQIEHAKAALADLERRRDRSRSPDERFDLLMQQVPIQDQIAELEQVLSGGIAAVMKRNRQKLVEELSAASESVRVSAAPVVGDQAAAALGLPSVAEAERIAANIEAAMRKDGVTDQASFQSVFSPTKNQPLPGVEEMADDIERAAAASEKVKENLGKASEKVKEAFNGDFWSGFNEGATRAVVSWTDFQAAGEDAAQSLIGGGLDGITNAITETTLATDGASQAWKRFGMSVLSELTRIITKLLIVKALQSAFGYQAGVALENGGVVEGNMGVQRKAFATGGVTSGPTLALFGEGRNREAFVPLPDNRRIPVRLMGNSGGQTFVFNISAVDGRDVQRMLVEQRSTIMGVWRHDVEHRVGTRQLIQRTAR